MDVGLSRVMKMFGDWRALLSVCVVVFVGCESTTLSPDWTRLEPPIVAPEFTLPQLDGAPVTLSGLRGRIVIMEFWATWCGPCRISTPSLDAIYRRYRDRHVTVLLINEGDSATQVRQWAERRFIAPILLDRDGDVGRLYRLAGIPELFVLNQEGRIVYAHSGYSGGLEHNVGLILDELLTAHQEIPRG